MKCDKLISVSRHTLRCRQVLHPRFIDELIAPWTGEVSPQRTEGGTFSVACPLIRVTWSFRVHMS